MQGFTVYVGIGAVVGLALFLLLFVKWELPKKIKSALRLNTKLKMFLFIILLGVVLTVMVTLLSVLLGLPSVWTECLQGLGIGFSCAIVVGFVSTMDAPDKGAPQGKQGAKRQLPDNRGRRSKG